MSADLIEEQRAAFGDLEAAFPGCDRIEEVNERFLVSEQLTFRQLGRNNSAVDRDERTLAARAGIVDRACRELFAGTGLAEGSSTLES